MTIQEMHIAVRQELDKTQDFTYPNFQAEQIDYWLNKAQLEIVNQLSYPVERVNGVDYGQKRVDDLQDIIVPDFNLAAIKNGNVHFSVLPSNYFHLLNHECTTIDFSCKGKQRTVKGTQVKLGQVKLWKNDPFLSSTPKEPLYYIADNKIHYLTEEKFGVIQGTISYISIPNKMRFGQDYVVSTGNIECSFTKEDMQHRIIDRAVSAMLENIESMRYQTQLNEVENN